VKKPISRHEVSASEPEDAPLVLHLTRAQMEELMKVFQEWYESAPTAFARRVRGRYWMAFLCLRFTGARIGEILRINDITDIDFSHGEIQVTVETDSRRPRAIPVPPSVTTMLSEYLVEFPAMRGKVFALDQGNFRREFYRRAEEAEIPRELSHPHILRHTRAIEMIQAGVPLTMVQTILGHTVSSTTVIYLRQSKADPKTILEKMGLL
jgi:molybdate transport system regulatory protein